MRPGFGAGSQTQGHERTDDGTHVDQHVAGVGQEGQGVGIEGRRHLERHEGDQQDQCSRQGSAIGVQAGAVVVGVPRLVLVLVPVARRRPSDPAQPSAITWSAWVSTSSTRRRTWASSTT